MHSLHLFFYLSILVPLVLSQQDAVTEASWTAITLQDQNITANDSDRAVAVATAEDSFLVAVERTRANSTSITPALYKVNKSGDLLWTFESEKLTGTPFDIAVDQKQETAYLVLSSVGVDSLYSFGHVARYTGISISLSENEVRDVVSEEIIFTTEAVPGNTKLFSCALDSLNGDLYVTGGTSASLYGESKGRTDVIVVRISSSGQVLATIQFGSAADEFGRAVDISEDSKTVAIAVQKILQNGGTESLLYRLDAKTLADTDGPQALLSYAATPLYTPVDIAVSGPLASEPGTVTAVIAGSALPIPDRKTDIFFHVFAQISESQSNVAVYVDGVADGKHDDHAVAIAAGADGNFYSIGYSSPSETSSSNSLNLVVISPTGKILHKTAKAPENTAPEERVMGMTLFDTSGRTSAVFVGWVRVGKVKRPSFGIVTIPPDTIPVFKGFGTVVEGAEADSPASPNGGSQPGSGIGVIPIATGVIAGMLVILVGAIGMVFYRKRNSQTVTGGDPSTLPGGIGIEKSTREQNSTLV